MAIQTTLDSGTVKGKLSIPARHAINWYFGNFLMSPGNALRDADDYCERVNKLIESPRLEGGTVVVRLSGTISRSAVQTLESL